MNGKDLNGKPWHAPAGFPADRTLVILGFEEEQQAAIDTSNIAAVSGHSLPAKIVPVDAMDDEALRAPP